MEYVRLGQIVKSFGLDGQVKVYSLTDFASARFKKGTTLSLYNEKNKTRQDAVVSFFRDSGSYYFLGFEGITDIDQTAALMGAYVEIDESKAPLPKGMYRLEDLKGCAILDESGKKLGIVSDILSYAPTKTLVVKREGAKDFFVPFVMKEFVQSIDIAKKEITIKVIPGLL
jgi:16S rRNA processing protein RimM